RDHRADGPGDRDRRRRRPGGVGKRPRAGRATRPRRDPGAGRPAAEAPVRSRAARMTTAADAPDVRDLLLGYETALANRDGAGMGRGLEPLVRDAFLEIGASGRGWTASQVRPLLGGEALPPVSLDDFAVTPIASDVVLATFHIGGPRPTQRSSIWVRRDGRWTV